MKLFFLSIVLVTIFCGFNSLKAQVTIGSAIVPNEGAILDLKQYDDAEAKAGGRTANKGMGMPRIKLTDLSSLSDIAGADLSDPEQYAGLLVYNVNEIPINQGVCSRTASAPGLYVWDGNTWNALSDSEIQTGEEVTDNVKYSGISADGLSWYILNDGTLNICGFGSMADYDNATNLAPWMTYASEITNVVVQDGVESVGNMAFYECVEIKSVIIGNSVETIGNQSFYECIGIENLYLGKSLKSIGNLCFTFCANLTSLILPNSLETLDVVSFGRLDNITTLTIPASVKKLNGSSFAGFGGTTIYAYCPISAYPKDDCSNATYCNTFYGAINNSTMYVPAEYYNDYIARQSSYWTPQKITISATPAP